MRIRLSRSCALLMTLIMVITMMPLPAFAAGDEIAVPTEPENGIPLIVINVEEQELYTDGKGDTYGTIQDMNSSEDHSVRCKGSVDILVPEGYSGGYGESVLSPDSETGKLQLSYIRGRGRTYKVVKGKKYYSSWSKIRVTKKIAYKRY